jgi:hypothetical protein
MNWEEESKYILNDDSYLCLENRSVRLQDIYCVTNNFIELNENVNIEGFTGSIENAGCTGNITTQENHVLQTYGGSVEPKNIVIRTQGSGTTYGSYFRDDTLTNPKGDIRGSGANDLSTFRTLCSQVASGDFSSILGGTNNTASGNLSVVVGGNSNISSGVNSTVIGGVSSTNSGNYSVVASGQQNNIVAGGDGYNVIGSGTGNTAGGGYNVVFAGTNNNIDSSGAKYNVIINGQINRIQTNVNQSVISSGSNNLIEQSNSVIQSGSNNQILKNGNGFNVISGGTGGIVRGTYNTVMNGLANQINSDNAQYNVIASGSRNIIEVCEYSVIGTGTDHDIVDGSFNVIICGVGHTAGGQYCLVGGGNGNIVLGKYNNIIGGSNNKINVNTAENNVIMSGTNNLIDANSLYSVIGSGIDNQVLNNYSVIGSGNLNIITVDGSGFNFIGSGQSNLCSGNYNAIVSGINNTVDLSSTSYNFIGAGSNNKILLPNTSYSFIGAGTTNSISNSYCGIGVGSNNSILSGGDGYHFISGGINNSIQGGSYNTIQNGNGNIIESSSSYNSIISGATNRIQTNSSHCVIVGGNNNSILPNSTYSFIGSGVGNTVSGTSTVIGSGLNNQVSGTENAIMCGRLNEIINISSSDNAIVSGSNNQITSAISNSFIGAGTANIVNENSSAIICGTTNQIQTGGVNSCIAGGTTNTISIANSFACGSNLEITSYNFPSAAFGQNNKEGSIGTGASAGNRIFMVGNGISPNPVDRRNAFSVNEFGYCWAGNNFLTSGADFGEYFESIYQHKIQTAEPVYLITQQFIGKTGGTGILFSEQHLGKIILSEDVPFEISTNIIPLGVTRINSAFVGNAHEEEWYGKYEKNQDGTIVYENIIIETEEEERQIVPRTREVIETIPRIINGQVQYFEEKRIETIQETFCIYEQFPLYDSSNNFIQQITKPKMKKIYRNRLVPKISSLFNPNLTYIPRSERPEWNLVGLVGQVYIRNQAPVSPRWIKMKEETNYSIYLIR